MSQNKPVETLQELVDAFNVKYGDYAGARYINQDVAEEAAKAARTLVKYMVDSGMVKDDAFTVAYKRIQQDEKDQDENSDF